MPQLNFEYNWPSLGGLQAYVVSNGTMSYLPINIRDSISWATINFIMSIAGGAGATKTISLGLYSLTGSSLSLANSASVTRTANQAIYVSLSDISAAQNITPGTWFLGLLGSTSGSSDWSIWGQSSRSFGNAFPGSFIGGVMTESTNALPSSYATSNLDITGSDAMFVPLILLTA